MSPRGHGSVYGEAAEPGMGPVPPPTAPLWPLQGSGPCLCGTRLQPLASAPEPACPGMSLTSSCVPHDLRGFQRWVHCAWQPGRWAPLLLLSLCKRRVNSAKPSPDCNGGCWGPGEPKAGVLRGIRPVPAASTHLPRW